MEEIRGKKEQRASFLQGVKIESNPKRPIKGRKTRPGKCYTKRGIALAMGLILVTGLGVGGHRIHQAKQYNDLINAVQMGEISLPTDEGMLQKIISQYVTDYNLVHQAESDAMLKKELNPETIEMTDLNGQIYVKREGEIIEQNDLKKPFEVDSVVANYTDVYQIYQKYQQETNTEKRVELYQKYLKETAKLQKRIERKEKLGEHELDPKAKQFLEGKVHQENSQQEIE